MGDDVISPELLEILACPLCRSEVSLDGERIVCRACGRRYPIRDGIPVMLVDEAELPGGAKAADAQSESAEEGDES